MDLIASYAGNFVFSFETSVEKEHFKRAICVLPGIEEVSDREGGRTLRIRVSPGSIGESILKSVGRRREISLDREDVYYYTTLILKHPLLKLLISAVLLGPKVGILSFLICSQVVMPFIKKTLK